MLNSLAQDCNRRRPRGRFGSLWCVRAQMRSHVLISVEGVHGAGKSAVARYLHDRMNLAGQPAILSQDQISTELSRRIRSLNVNAVESVDVYTEVLLVAAARRQTYVDIIKPSLNSRRSVVTERFLDSFFAFGWARGVSDGLLQSIAEHCLDDMTPKVTLLLDIAPEKALARIPVGERHRVEREDINFHRKLREGFLKQACLFPGRIYVIDASAPLFLVQNRAWQIVGSSLLIKEPA